MWSGPRNISTAFMRSFENRPDTFVTDEPFYAHYLHKTGINHPYSKKVMADGNTDWNIAVDEITGPIPNGKTVWYQKHMAQHNFPGCDMKWVEKLTNCILIRDPQEVMLSFSKKYEITSISQLGYPQQMDLFKLLTDMGSPPLIIDASDVLKNPDKALKMLCRKLDIPFFTEMLNWPAGRRESDGIWSRHWYGSVEASTGFHPYIEKKGDFPLKYQDIYTACLEHYQHLYSHRMPLFTEKIADQSQQI